tara:strand:+ start:399 stop:965 length:567 start_codon:yes stop_codon:yes gene_type:complete
MNKNIVVIVGASQSNDPMPEVHITEKQHKEVFRIIFKILKKFPEYNIIIKGRKGWDMDELPQMIADEINFKDFEYIEETEPIKLLFNADIIITEGYSTMALEALLLNKPVISIGFKSFKKVLGYKNIKEIKTVYNEKQFEKAFKSIQKQKKKINNKKELEKELFKLDGKSTQRAIKFINKLLSNKNDV